MVFSTLRRFFPTRRTRALKVHRTSAGFSLIELLAVTGVMALVSGVILVSNSKFGGKVLLQNLAYDIALSIRQSQVYGIAVQRFGTNTFSAGYGVHFDISSPSNYILFGDAITVNGLYDCPTPGSVNTCEQVEATTITNGFRIYQLCATLTTGGTEDCTSFSGLDVLFKRPDPDAWISVKPSSGTFTSCITVGSTACYSSARIRVRSPRGDLSSILIDQNGQITVQ